MKAEWTNADALTPSETTGKSILVIDTPKECDGCPCLNRKLWECQADKKRRSSDERPDWCPLKPMPSKKVPIFDLNSASYDEEYEKRIMYEIDGYNRCIDEIMGETE